MNGKAKKMRVIKRATLEAFWTEHASAQGPLVNWYDTITGRRWAGLAELKQYFSRSVDFVGGKRYVFNVGEYRLVAKIDFKAQIAFVRFIGTHAEYDKIQNIDEI